ncbi:unnamed protein product [Pleuronectes platessa]|uniref:Uncharacterized protein n=1 Tax=Pleuronectes platessa TaxID=8262 RepID=A0A9N7V8S0_PLEPL|nr:unnamed protein product [Pleuronectes platessa]
MAATFGRSTPLAGNADETSSLYLCSLSEDQFEPTTYAKKTRVVKTQEKKERWKEKKEAKRQKKEDEAVVEEEENVQPVLDPLENGFLNHAQREQERMNERLLKKTYSKKNKMIKPLVLRPVKVTEDETMQELSRPQRSNSKEQLSESSTHSLSGRGYSNMSHSYSPAAAYSQMDENKQDLPKKLAEPFGSSCQFESAGNKAFSLYEKRKEGDGEREGRSGDEGGGCLLVVVAWGQGHCASQAKSSNKGRKFHVVLLPLRLSSGAICSVCSLWAPPGR